MHPGIAASWETCWPLLACVFLMGVHSAFFGRPSTGCCRSCCRKNNCPGATVCWNSAPSWPLFSASPPLPGCPPISGPSPGCPPWSWSGWRLWAWSQVWASPAFPRRTRAKNSRRIFSAQFSVRCGRGAATGPHFVGDRQHLFQFSRPVAVPEPVFLRPRGVASGRNGHRAALDVAGAGHRGGQVAAGYLSGGKIEYGLVPLGALGMSVVSASLVLPCGSVRARPGSDRGAGFPLAAFSSCRFPHCCNIVRQG